MNFIEVPKDKWPKVGKDPEKVWINKKFMVQLMNENGNLRLSINRVHHKIVKGYKIWDSGITWDELQDIKDALGYDKCWMVEVYPPMDLIVNVANMRHLWLLPEKPIYGWKNEKI